MGPALNQQGRNRYNDEGDNCTPHSIYKEETGTNDESNNLAPHSIYKGETGTMMRVIIGPRNRELIH